MKKRFLPIIFIFIFVLTSISPVHALSSDNYKVQWLIENKYIDGYEDGSLKLENNITRAEITKIITHIKGEEALANNMKNHPSRFNDVETSHWANGYINLAAEKGYIKGYEDGSFKAEKNISNEELITIITRLDPEFVEKPNNNSDWSKQFVEFAKDNGLLDDISISNLKDNASRKTAFEIVYNFSKENNKIENGRQGNSSNKILAAKTKTESNSLLEFYNYRYWQDYNVDDRLWTESRIIEESTYRRIRFFVDGDLVSKVLLDNGSFIVAPEVPIKKGYKFIGWFYGENKYDLSTRVFKNLDLVALYEKSNASAEKPKDPKEITEYDDSKFTTLAIKTQPKLTYLEGENLDLSSLEVVLVDSNNLSTEVKFKDFDKYNITVNAQNGSVLRTTDNDSKLLVKKANQSLETNEIKVKEKPSESVNVNYYFVAEDNQTVLPTEVMNQLPKSQSIKRGTDVRPESPAQMQIKSKNGTWEFIGYSPEIVEAINVDTNFVGKWKLVYSEDNFIKDIGVISKIAAGKIEINQDKTFNITSNTMVISDFNGAKELVNPYPRPGSLIRYIVDGDKNITHIEIISAPELEKENTIYNTTGYHIISKSLMNNTKSLGLGDGILGANKGRLDFSEFYKSNMNSIKIYSDINYEGSVKIGKNTRTFIAISKDNHLREYKSVVDLLNILKGKKEFKGYVIYKNNEKSKENNSYEASIIVITDVEEIEETYRIRNFNKYTYTFDKEEANTGKLISEKIELNWFPDINKDLNMNVVLLKKKYYSQNYDFIETIIDYSNDSVYEIVAIRPEKVILKTEDKYNKEVEFGISNETKIFNNGSYFKTGDHVQISRQATKDDIKVISVVDKPLMGDIDI